MRTARQAWRLIVLGPIVLVMGGCAEDSLNDDPNTRPASQQTEPSDAKSDTPSFTFVRIEYSSRRGPSWNTDYPASDENFSARFKEVTHFKTDPKGRVLQLTNPDLKQYPFIYMAEGGGVLFREEEVQGLRGYLLGGGFLMVDDFWGEAEWQHFYSQIKRVFPDHEPFELGLDHPIFNCFYKIEEKPQVPMIAIALRNQSTGVTWEREDAKEPHYFGLQDDKGHLMAVFCHNTDLADGWEREGESDYYDQEFVFKKAYPMGINIVFYALTH